MIKTHSFTCSIASALLLGASSASAAIDSAAAKVELRQSCTENGASLDNCFTGFPELINWMSTVRQPNAENPLQVNIGPGTFDGGVIPGTTISIPDINISCNPSGGYTGYTSFQGSGNNQTTIKGTGSGGSSAVNISNCTELSFSDLKLTTNFYGGVYWNGGGNSRWNNVEVDTNGRAWAEITCGAERGNHYWYSSKINTNSVFGIADTYRASCDETWFFGSEVKATIPQGQGALATSGVVSAYSNGIIHLYGSNLRSISDGSSSAPAANSFSGGEIHIHGTGIDVISTSGNDVVALKAGSGGLIHADVSAYVMQTSGSKTRILNNGGTVKAPYQWGQNNQPPQVVSDNGADMIVETHCDPVSCHDEDTGTETHLLIYNENCDVAGHGPWFDVVTRKCRGDMTPN